MHTVDPDRSDEAVAPRRDSGAVPRRVTRMLAIVFGGAVTGVLVGAPTGLVADIVGLPSGASAAVAALAFVTLALGIRWFALHAARGTAEVTPLHEDRDQDRRAA